MADVIKTVGSAGTFPTLQAWADDIRDNTGVGGLYTSGDRAICHVQENISQSTTGMTARASAVPLIGAIIQPEPGNEHGGVVGGGISITVSGASQRVLYLYTHDYPLEVRDLEIVHTGATSVDIIYMRENQDTHVTALKRCIVRLTDAGNTGVGVRCYNDFSVLKVIRCMVVGAGGIGIRQGEISNCSIDNCVTGIELASGNVANNIVLGSTTCFTGTASGTNDKNMSSDATAPGTTTYHNETRSAIWTDPDNDDWSLLTGTNAIGNGNDLGSTNDENIDITGATVTGAWDLGAYHGGSVPPPPTAGGPVLRVHGV